MSPNKPITGPLDPITMLPVPAPKPGPIARQPKGTVVKDRNIKLDGSFRSVCALLGPKEQGSTILINLVRSIISINPDAASFISFYDSKPTHLRQRRGPGIKSTSGIMPDTLEDLCTEHGIPWPRLVGWAFEAAASTGQHLAAMKAALSLPEVVDKTIKFAKTSKGFKDRELLARATGFLPTPSSNISIVNQLAANAQAKNIATGGDAFVPFEDDVIDIEQSPAPQLENKTEVASGMEGAEVSAEDIVDVFPQSDQ